MKFKYTLIICLFFLSFSIYSQNKEKEVTLKINKLIEEQEEKIRALLKVRSAPQSWLKTYDTDSKKIAKVLNNYHSKNIGILVYSFKNDSIKLSLISKPLNKASQAPKFTEIKLAVNKKEISTYIDDVNYLYSSTFFNRAPKKRGTIVIDNKKQKVKLNKSFVKLNELLFPNSFNLEKFDHLILVSTLNIATLPFSVFKIKNEYLIDLMSYSIAPNIFELFASERNNDSKHKSDYGGREIEYFWENALFVSNPSYSNNLEWSFPNLPGAEEEVNYVIKKSSPILYNHFNSKNATKKNILKNICNYDLIYFATHGITDADEPMDKSFLVLAEDNSDKPYITLREIMNIRKECKLKADLVVLSACQTGLGKAHEGGTIGLARAFQIAGANHVLMSLWNIDDKETATLMKFFFDELAIGKEMMPHAALRNAVLKYKKEVNEDPKYWAAFSLFGVPY